MSTSKDLHERITTIVHESLSPLLTDTLGVEHGWDAAEGVASAILKQHMSINLELTESLEAVKALHQQRGGSYKTCSHCIRPSGYPNRSEQPVAWPCPTISALEPKP